jgi:alkanesulfonate monooxygenase
MGGTRMARFLLQKPGMSIEFIWQLPARGDGHYADAAVRRRGERSSNEPAPLSPGVSDPRDERFNYFDHLHQIARAAELSGFDGVNIQHDPRGDESWIIAGYLVRGTRRLKLVTEFEASWGSSVYAAKNAASFQRYSAGRFAWHLQAGAASRQRRKNADPVPDEDVLPRIGEFLQVARGVLTQAPFSFNGRFFEVQNGGFKDGLDHQPVPQVYWSGTSRAALELSAEHADVHVLSPAPFVELSQTVQTLKQLAGQRTRTLRYGLRLDLLARETDGEALRDARRFRSQLAETSVASTIEGPGLVARVVDFAHRRGLGARRQLWARCRRSLEISGSRHQQFRAGRGPAPGRGLSRLARMSCRSCDIGLDLHHLHHPLSSEAKHERRHILANSHPRRAGLAP